VSIAMLAELSPRQHGHGRQQHRDDDEIQRSNCRYCPGGRASGECAGSVRRTPSGVSSYAQASTTATGKPSISSTTIAVVRPSGRCSAGMMVEATSISTQATTP